MDHERSDVQTAAEGFCIHDRYGVFQLAICDGKLDDDELSYCLSRSSITASEKAFGEHLLSMALQDRVSAWRSIDKD